MNKVNLVKSQQYSSKSEKEYWTKVISPKNHLMDLRLYELWRYKDLIFMFVKRDFVTNFKQTILGPIWFFIQPLLTTATFIIIFGKVAQLSTDGMPMLLFYLAGVTIWNYFSETLNKTATVFKDNESLFGKVYFPRLTMPLSIVISKLLRFCIQFALFLIVWTYFLFQTNTIQPNYLISLTPVLIIIMGCLGLGFGLVFSALTTKYKDLGFLLSFGVQLLMYATPVIYPISSVPEKYKWLILSNPLSAIVETFRYAFLGSGTFNAWYLLYSFISSIAILIAGMIIFNRAEKSFTDIV